MIVDYDVLIIVDYEASVSLAIYREAVFPPGPNMGSNTNIVSFTKITNLVSDSRHAVIQDVALNGNA